MQRWLLALGLLACVHSSAQLPEDALRASWTTPGGTAREQAIGGAMGSLGGDISAAYINPAGLGLYKTSELVLSPGWRFLGDKTNYLGTGMNGSSVNNFNLGASGIVLGYDGAIPGVTNTFSLAVNRTADFNNHISYRGYNDYSSFAEQFSEEFAGSGLDIGAGIASPALSYGTRMALFTSLIDTATVNGVPQVIARPLQAARLLQQNDMATRGGITEINLSLATCRMDKWFIGGGLGFPIMNFTRYQTYTESDASGNPNDNFQTFTYNETYTTRGWGVKAVLGVIFSPSAPWRLGLAVHTSTEFALTDKISANMVTRTKDNNQASTISISSDSLDRLTGLSPQPNSIDYTFYTPWRFIASASYVFGSGEADTKKQKGFVTADIEYSTTHNPHYALAADENTNGSGDHYYDALNQVIRNSYRNTFDFRLGGEMKFDRWMVRAGGAYYTSPYSQAALKADRLYLSAGLGYRIKAFFVDLAYVMNFTRDIDVPYRLADKENFYAALKETGGTAILTVGIKL
jgi:hypothetical protein